MKKNFLIKLFIIVFIQFVLFLPAKAIIENYNTLSSIIIEKADNNTYKLNLVFKSKYQGNAFIQKKSNGSYYIFLPKTYMNAGKSKVVYKSRKDKSNINIKLEEKPYITSSVDSSYVRMTVNTKDDYSLKIVSNTEKEIQPKGIIPFLKGFFKMAGFMLCLVILFMFLPKFINKKQYNQETISGIIERRKSVSENNFKTERQQNNNIQNNETERITSPSVMIKKSLKTPLENSFSCFDIIDNQNVNKKNYYDFKRTLNNNSVLLSNQKIKSNIKAQTNPIKKNTEIELPAAEDVIKEPKKEVKQVPELISVLNITHNTGFYLTNVGETLALFGFVNDNVFLLKKFSDLSQINLQARFYDKHGENDLYIVKLDTYKAMIEISETGMKELAVL